MIPIVIFLNKYLIKKNILLSDTGKKHQKFSIIKKVPLIGGFFILMLYLILFFRTVKISQKTDNGFAQLLATGLCFLLVFQGFINMAVAVNLVPVTGQPLPLVSMGGTSTWFTCLSLGIILSVSRGVELENKNKLKIDDYAIA